MMDWGDSGWSWWWMLPMMMFMVVVVGAVIWAVLAVSRPGSDTSREAPPQSAEEILHERFARGEIESAEYHDRLDALRGHGTAQRS
jgi:putative membrane protein